MADLRLPGLLSGIDTNTLIANLMAIERRTLYMHQARKSTWEEKQSALNTLESKLTSLRTSVRALSNADELRAFSTTSSDSDILTAEASYNAFEGNHTVEINQLATAERWVHTAGEANDWVPPVGWGGITMGLHGGPHAHHQRNTYVALDGRVFRSVGTGSRRWSRRYSDLGEIER